MATPTLMATVDEPLTRVEAATVANSSATETKEVYLAVIGLGSAGENLAKRVAGSGRSVVGFDPGLVGGACPFLACIPSKVLLHHVEVGSDWPTALAHREETVHGRDDSQHADGLTDAGVELVRSAALLVDEQVVEADGRRWRAEHVVLATGSDPVVPDLDGLDPELVWTSDDAMSADELPSSMIVLGGGAVGCELSTVHSHFGDRTVLIDHGETLGGGDIDPDVADALADQLRERGIDLRFGVEAEAVEHLDENGRVRLSGEGTDPVEADRLLLAVGRSPAWDGLGLDDLGIATEIDEELRIDGCAWLWALGDLNGQAPWTHGANLQADWLAARLMGEGWPGVPHVAVAHCVFTRPPVAAVGLSHQLALAEGIDAVRGVAGYDDTARSATDRLGAGTVVVVADRQSRRLLGCSGIGPGFDDVISTISVMIDREMTVDEAARFVIPFPTITQVLTSAVKNAAEAM